MYWPRQEVGTFAQDMERKLQKHDHKRGWYRMTNAELIKRLKEEVAELEQELANKEALKGVGTPATSSLIINECADVANFAMMLADNNRT